MTGPARAEPRRRASAAQTRRRLIAAGRRAFASRGLAGAKLVEDILDPAGVSVGSFYHQFRDKTDLLLAILREHSEAFRGELSRIHRPGPGRSALDIARASYAMVLDMAERNEDVLRIQLRERSSDDPRVRAFVQEERERWLDSLTADYRRIARAGGFAIEARLVAELVVGLSLGVAAQLIETPPRERAAARRRLLDGLVAFSLGGIPALTGETAKEKR